MHWRRRIGLLLLGALVATVITTLVAEPSINPYQDREVPHEYHWTYRGGPFMVISYHPAWPEIEIPSEWKLNAVGIALSLGFWSALFACAWFMVYAWRRTMRPHVANTDARAQE
ncbi:MAG: hypothetical protein QNJ90_16645 [Planctomycetota bacterium]|nr:hypothetical protein [Planctomycetota bacterium]